jgi:hypothetical protein
MASTIIMSITITIVGMSLFSDDIETAQTFCIEMAKKIESEKEKTGTYPSNIEAFLKNHHKLPRFINKRRLYIKNDTGYILQFVATGGLFPRLYTYSGKTGEWKILD